MTAAEQLRPALPRVDEWERIHPPLPGECWAVDFALPDCLGAAEVYTPDELHPYARVCLRCAKKLEERT